MEIKEQLEQRKEANRANAEEKRRDAQWHSEISAAEEYATALQAAEEYANTANVCDEQIYSYKVTNIWPAWQSPPKCQDCKVVC